MMRQKFLPWATLKPLALSITLFCALLAMAPVASAQQACGALHVDNAWVRVVPGAAVSAGYFELTNPGDAAVTVKAISSPQFGRAHMHESIAGDNGTTTMKPVSAVTVAPGQALSFAPGGYHLMLFKPQRKLVPGDTVTLQLTCSGTGHRQVTAEVRSMVPMSNHNKSMDMHMDHNG